MSEDKKPEILIEASADRAPNNADVKAPQKTLSMSTKFFMGLISVILIWHFISAAGSSSKINELNKNYIKATEDIGKLKLDNSTLKNQLADKDSQLGNTANRLKIVNEERDEKILETSELKKIVDAYKVNASEGAKLHIERLNKRLVEWEKYYSEILKKRPSQK